MIYRWEVIQQYGSDCIYPRTVRPKYERDAVSRPLNRFLNCCSTSVCYAYQYVSVQGKEYLITIMSECPVLLTLHDISGIQPGDEVGRRSVCCRGCATSAPPAPHFEL